MEPKTPLHREHKALKQRMVRLEKELEALRARSLFFDTLSESIHEEIMLIDENFIICDVNTNFLKNGHFSKPEDVVGKKCFQILHDLEQPCDEDGHLCPLEMAKKTGSPVELSPFPKKGDQEYVRIMYPVAGEEGSPRHFLEISWDVTAYQDLIKKLQSSEKKFRAILDTATDGIISVDERQRIILFNNAAQTMFGYTRDEIMGKNLNLLIPKHYGDHFRFVRRFIDTRTPRVTGKTLSLHGLRKGGETFPIELALSHLEIKGRVTFTAIIRDISLQKQLEKKVVQSARLAAVGQAVAHVAHEIKNPLMIIGGFTHQIRRHLDDDRALQKLDMVFEEVNRLEKLVANLGDFTKEYRLVKRLADINAGIRDVIEIMREIYDTEHYDFEAELSPGLNEILCDPDKLKQVYINIIANGIEAMKQGGTIRVRTEKAGNHVAIHISDQGVGINEEDLLRIFEPFYTTRKKGSGLGLSISYKIIEAHRGDIWANSRAGRGTTFSIRIPAE